MRSAARLLVLSSLLASFSACQKAQKEPVPDASPTPAAPGSHSYGAGVTLTKTEDLEGVLRSPAGYAGQTVLVEGHVRRACSRKGCWMEVASAPNDNAPGCRVTFQDYSFFVPTDSAGKMARVEGVVEVETVKKSHVEHLEEEGATFGAKNSDGTATEVRLVATGVELRDG